MTRIEMQIIVAALLMLGIVGCNDNPVKPKQDHNPVVLSVTVFPQVVKPSDSVIVICKAMDPDGDSLVYDWFAYGGARIKGAGAEEWMLYNMHENFHIFYAPDSAHVSAPLDTMAIHCDARDGIGGSGNGPTVYFVVKKDP